MSLYENKSDSGVKLPSVNVKRFPIFLVLMVLYISIVTIVNTGSYFAAVLGTNHLRAADVVTSATGMVLSSILLSFCLGFIRHVWPPVLVSIFAVVSLAKFITAEVVTTDFKYMENFTYLKYSGEMFYWFGTATGTPYKFMALAGIKFRDIAIDSQRLIHIGGVSITLIVCSLLLYFWYINEKRAEPSKV